MSNPAPAIEETRDHAQRGHMVTVQHPTPPSLQRALNTKGTLTAGYVVVAGFFLTFGLWAIAAPISNAAIAPGVVFLTGNNKSVQHLEGGIVRRIMAKDGDEVSRNQPLIELDATELTSRYDNLLLTLLHASVEYARWQAEYQNQDLVTYPSAEGSPQRYPADKLAAAILTQNSLFAARRTSFSQSLQSIDDRITQAGAQVNAAARRLRTLQTQLSAVSGEHRKYREFERQGLVTRNKVFDLQQKEDALALEVAQTSDTTTLLADKIKQLQSQRQELTISNRQLAAQNISRLQSVLDKTQPQLQHLQKKLDRLVIRAPIAGRVMNMSVNTNGSVINAGQVIMQIVPSGEQLLVVSKVSPQDRDTVSVGQSAQIRFSAFDRRSSKPVEGTVQLISADSLIDPATQLAYYKTTIAPQFTASDSIDPNELFPGMQAEVLIITGEQTLFQYLLGPITRSFNRALRES